MKKLFLSFFILTSFLFAQQNNTSNKLPVDPNVIIGELENGLKYYIRQNAKPENRAELRLAVDAGSILENDNQLGLAHFTEHMAFNGTKNFEEHELIDFLESTGIRFGPELNAYTSFDETVYMLQVRTDSVEVLKKAFQVLEDWAHLISFEDTEIDKERGVIIEEWRLGRGANARMRDKQFPIIFKNSRYAERLPIGEKEILENFEYETLKQFYKDWYRPELMAVVAVGDFNTDSVEALIKNQFMNLRKKEKANKREYFDVPDHENPLYAIATDKEAMYSTVGVYYKRNNLPVETLSDYRRKILFDIYNGMFNTRLKEISREPGAPFTGAGSGMGDLVRTKKAYVLSAMAKEGKIDSSLKVLLREAKRVEKFGFTESELERRKKNILRSIERRFLERDKTESYSYAQKYVYNFLKDNPIPGIENRYELYKKYIPEVTIDEINNLADAMITDSNKVVVVSAPEKEGLEVPNKEQLEKVFDEVKQMKVEAYEDKLSGAELLSDEPKPSEIVEEKRIEEIDITEIILSNGVNVILKPTDFKNDEVLFSAFSPGGTSLAPDDKYYSASVATSIIDESGVGEFDLDQLEKLLAGKVVSVSPYISELYEGFSGSVSKDDLETLFQLIYLYFEKPRADSSAFESYKSKIETYLKNREASPRVAFQDTLQLTMAQNHFRAQPWSEKTIENINLNEAYEFYKDRFMDAEDFTFLFVGSFDVDSLTPYIKKYLGGLPSSEREESWKDIGKEFPQGIIKKKVFKGVEPKSQAALNFTGDFVWNRENIYTLRSLIEVLNIRLREAIREDESGTYGVRAARYVYKNPNEEYLIQIGFGSDPERVDELTKKIMEQIDSLKKNGPEEKTVQKVKEIQLRSREKNLKQNRTWLYSLESSYKNEEDPLRILDYEKLINGLTPEQIQQAAQKYFDMNNYVQVLLYPEEFAEAAE